MTTTAYITSADITSADTALTKAKPTTTFDPTDAAGMKAWYRKGTGITVTGAGVSKWADQSGNGNDLLQATDTNRPSQEADGSILFDGVDNWLKCNAFTLNQPETIYIFGKHITWTDNDYWFDGNTDDSGILFQNGTSNELKLHADATVNTNTDLPLDVYDAIVVVFNGASSYLQVGTNAAVGPANAGAANMGGFALGEKADELGGHVAHIQIKEVAIYNTAHDAATRAKVIAYLSNL